MWCPPRTRFGPGPSFLRGSPTFCPPRPLASATCPRRPLTGAAPSTSVASTAARGSSSGMQRGNARAILLGERVRGRGGALLNQSHFWSGEVLLLFVSGWEVGLGLSRKYTGKFVPLCLSPFKLRGSVGAEKKTHYAFCSPPFSVSWAAGLSRRFTPPETGPSPLRGHERAPEYHQQAQRRPRCPTLRGGHPFHPLSPGTFEGPGRNGDSTPAPAHHWATALFFASEKSKP